MYTNDQLLVVLWLALEPDTTVCNHGLVQMQLRETLEARKLAIVDIRLGKMMVRVSLY